MGKTTFGGFKTSVEDAPLQGAFVTGANLRSSLKTKSPTPPSREAGAKAAAEPARSSNPKTQQDQ